MTCAKDTSGKWDYVCTEATTGTILEIDVEPQPHHSLVGAGAPELLLLLKRL
jgi:hypothetical protein